MKREEDLKCKDRVLPALHGRMTDLIAAWDAYCTGEDENSFPEYGLSFDYVAPETFDGQREGYWRYQISLGGPSEEFRFYSSGPDWIPHRIEFWFLDWYDGADIILTGEYEKTMLEIWHWFEDVGAVESEYRKAVE